MRKSWYEIRNGGSDVAEVLLFDEISTWGISAADFIAELQGIKAGTINLRINSPGGDVFEGIAIYNGLKRHPAAVHAVVDGIAASTASFIAQAGDTVLMAEGATMMIHEPYGGLDVLLVGGADHHREVAKEAEKQAGVLDKMGDTIASLYASRAGGSEAEWRERMRVESWYRAQEAVDANLADGLVETQAENRIGIFNLSHFRNVPDWVPQDSAAITGGPCLDAILNPYPNEHACRLRPPSDFQPNSFRRMSREHDGKRYDVIIGRPKGESTTQEQAYHYPKGTWTAEAARSHCQDHDGSFEAASEDKVTPPDDGLPEIDLARAVRIGVGQHLEPDMLPDHDFVSALKEGTQDG